METLIQNIEDVESNFYEMLTDRKHNINAEFNSNIENKGKKEILMYINKYAKVSNNNLILIHFGII